MNKIIIVFTLLIIASGCKINKVEKTQPIQEIEYKSSSCFGRCKVQNLLINKNKIMVYEGIQHVPNIGKFESTITANDYQKLIALFTKANFSEMENDYLTEIADLPQLSIRFGEKTIIFHERSAPPELQKIFVALENIITKYDWATNQ